VFTAAETIGLSCVLAFSLPAMAADATSRPGPMTRPATGATARALPPGVKLIENVEYAKVGDRSLLLDVYVPSGPKSPLPLVVWMHGGGWQSGSKIGGGRVLPMTQRGYVTASIDYRLSGEAIFPAQLDDCKAAVRFLRANAARYGIDPSRIGVAGASAGGHLASLLGVTGGMKDTEGSVGANLGQSTRVQAVVNYYGPTDLLNPGPVNTDLPRQDWADARLLGGIPREIPDKARRASPIAYVGNRNLPPFLLVHGDLDEQVPLVQSVEFEKAMRAAGHEATLLIVKDAAHSLRGEKMNRKRLSEIQDKVYAFFDKHLKNATSAPASQ